MTPLAIGVIGAGAMGARHATNLATLIPGARVAGIYDLDGARARAVAASCDATAFDDPTALIYDARVSAIIVVSPDPTHAAFVQECLRADKPVLCEKPLATTAAEALAIVESERALGRRMVSVGFMRRFDPHHLAVRDAVASGAIGRAVLFKGVHRNVGIAPDLPAATVITNSSIHDLDSARWLLGQEVREVYVSGVRTRATFSEGTRDMLLFQLTLGGGCLATIETSVAVEYGYEVSAEIVGERGTAMTAQPDGALLRASAHRGVFVPPSHLDRFQQAFVPELIDWVESIQRGRPFAGASAWDGYMATLVAEACIESLQRGAPVSVPQPERPALYASDRR